MVLRKLCFARRGHIIKVVISLSQLPWQQTVTETEV